MTNGNTGKRLAADLTSTAQEIGVEEIKAANGKTPFKRKFAKKHRLAQEHRIESSDGEVVWVSAAQGGRDDKD